MARDTINRHRGLAEGDLPRRYLRRDERAHPDELEADDDGSHDHYYDDRDEYWGADRGTEADDFLLHRLSTEVVWSIAARSPRWIGERSEAPPAEAPPPVHGLPPDALPDALFAHIDRFVSAAALNNYLECATAQEALAELASAHQARPGLVRWFAERPGPAFVTIVLAPFWIRSLRAWVPPETDDVDVIGRKLVEHLFVRYPVPEALFEPWRAKVWPTLKWVLWLVVIGQGASLRRAAARFRWDVAGAFVHHLGQAPPTLRPVEAVVWAEVRRLGGNDTDFRRLIGHPAYVLDPTSVGPFLPEAGAPEADAEPQAPFWRATVAWMIRHRDQLTDPDAQWVLEWAMHRHTEDLAGDVPDAEQFSWRGRTAGGAVAAAREYAEVIVRGRGAAHRRPYLLWRARGWDWTSPPVAEGSDATWTVQELTSTALLIAESAAMSHCVSTYDFRCAQNMSAIFSLCFDGERRATIEIAPTSRRVVQARGQRNRACTAEELAVIGRWLAAIDPASR